MSYEDDEDQDALAAEYVLGTLDANERAQAQALIALDPGFAALVRTWERRLGELNVMVEPAEPPQDIWAHIKARVAGAGAAGEPRASLPPGAPMAPAAPGAPVEPTLSFEPTAFFRSAPIVHIGPDSPAETPEAPPQHEPSIDFGPLTRLDPPAASAPAAKIEPVKPIEPGPDSEFPGLAELVAERQKSQQVASPEAPAEPAANVLVFRRRARRWRAFAGLTSALAACLAGYMVVWAYAPDRLPPKLRLPNMVQVQVVEKEIRLPPPAPPAPATPSRFVAVLQREPSAPAFLLTVDVQNRSLTVRRVAADKEPGKSYELWLVSNRLPGPRSLGVVGADDFTRRPLAETFAADVVNTATYAVSLEPEGGSPTGSPTGPVLFTGRLVESLPAQPARTP